MQLRYLNTFFALISFSAMSYGQGNGIQNISNYGGNGGANEFFRESNGQEYYTVFDKIPLDTNKAITFSEMQIGVEEGKEVGFEKNFKEGVVNGIIIPFAREDFVDLVSSDINEGLKNKSQDYGFKTGNEASGVVAKSTLKNIKYNFEKKKGEYRKLSIQVEVEWQFVKDGNVLFSATTTGYFINISEKKANISYDEAFNSAIVASLDKIFSIEDFRKAFAL